MRRTSAVLLLGAAAAAPRAARADAHSIHVLGHLQTAWTDNLLSAPEDDDPNTPEPEADFYTQISPGLLVSYETPRTIHELTADLDANLYARNDEAYSLQGRGGWRGFFLTSPRSELSTAASFATGETATMSTSQPASMGTGTVQPGGNNTFWSVEGAENLSWTATQAVRVSQSVRLRRFETTDETTGISSGGSEVGLSGGVDRGWQYTAVAFQLSASYVTLTATGAEESTDTVNSNAVVSYRRDFGPRWNALFDGGAAAVIPLDEGETVVQPTVGAMVGYAPNWGHAGLQLRRSLAPNLALGQNTVTDSATINASLPTPWLTNDPNLPKLVVSGSGGFTRTQTIDSTTGTLQSGFDVVHADVAIQYQPRIGLGFALRGQHLRQVAADDAVGAMTTFDYDRTTVIVSMTYRFPDRLAAEIPLRDSLRVDRGGNTSVGEESPPSVAPGSP